MVTEQRYKWLKLKNNYFNQLEQRKMAMQPHGKEMQIIYLRMMLMCIDTAGYIYYQGVYDTLEEELAIEFNEPIELIKETLEFIVNNNMISQENNFDYFLPEVTECIGSECASAERVRKHRANKKMLQCNTNVTQCNVEKDKDIEKENRYITNYQEIISMYNDTCVSYPKVQSLSEARKKAIKARLKQYTVEDFKRLFELAESSDFLKGGNNRNWSANFDWLIKDANMAKVLDGNYNTTEQLTATSQPEIEELSPEMQELYRQIAIEQLNKSMGWEGDEYNEPPFE